MDRHSSFGVNKADDVGVTSDRTDNNKQMKFGEDEQVGVSVTSAASSAVTDYSLSGIRVMSI